MAQPGGFAEVNDPSRPIRVAVIGGGVAAMTAAFELTRPEHNNRYQVTVYQSGWRLGGEGGLGTWSGRSNRGAWRPYLVWLL